MTGRKQQTRDRRGLERRVRKRGFEYTYSDGTKEFICKLKLNQIRDLEERIRDFIPSGGAEELLKKLSAGDVVNISLDILAEIVCVATGKSSAEVGELDIDDVFGIVAELLRVHIAEREAVFNFFEVAAPILSGVFQLAVGAGRSSVEATSKTNADSGG